MKSARFLATTSVLALACFVAFSPPEDMAAYIVALICGAFTVWGLSLVRDERERATLIQLFCGAFVLRLLFTLVAYKAGLVSVLGGADDQGWLESWDRSRGWLAGTTDSLASVYSGANLKQNMGFRYGASYLYYALDIRSQMALSFLNCFAGALTVIVIYKIARDYFSRESSVVAAAFAAILPSFLIWSALSVKESWVILFEITAFFAFLQWSRKRNPLYVLLAAAMIFATLVFRYYVAVILISGGLLSLACLRARRPGRAALGSIAGLFGLFFLLNNLGVVRLDAASIVQSQLADATYVRNALARGGDGGGSSVRLDYDVTTTGGMLSLIAVGASYLLLSPFPWQLGGRQIFALPDVLLWWGLLIFLIGPGALYALRKQSGLLISLLAYVLPLILLYSLTFGNIGLAYRQRAQLMPFFLVLAAAGSEARREQKTGSTLTRKLRLRLARTRLDSGASATPPAVTASS